ncbi:MAG TPA: ABC transporter permease [Candidatus Limnocylindria bacterium]|nr:ABC transporter permease [Candidatus Limnocylindria bacterium]
MTGILKSLVRMSSFIGKELRELRRRPGVIATLVLGPLLVMVLFGVGYVGQRQPFSAEIVLPAGSNMPTDPGFYQEMTQDRMTVQAVGTDRDAALRRLGGEAVDLVVVAPADAEARLRAGEQSVIEVYWNQVDPLNDGLARLAMQIMVSELNQEIIRRAAAEGIQVAGGELGEPVDIDPNVVAEPTRGEEHNVAPSEPATIAFFGPAVFALVLQHLAVTLTALSLVRERLSGQMDRYRVSPLNSSELLVGKYVAYGLFCLVVSALVAGAMVTFLGVPNLGGWVALFGIVLLLTFASLGLGLLISLVADSERQAVQLSMLVLLASVFFSGFVLPVEDFIPAVRPVAYALPVTHGIATLQESMLRGEVRSLWAIGALAGLGVGLYVIALLRLRRIVHRVD